VSKDDPVRSYERITLDDLRRLAEIARVDREEFFARKPQYRPLAGYVFAVALCQGAGLHYVTGRTASKTWTCGPFTPSTRRLSIRHVDQSRQGIFGDRKFGQTDDSKHFVGRRVDCLGRSLPIRKGSDPVAVLRDYLGNARTQTARKLALSC